MIPRLLLFGVVTSVLLLICNTVVSSANSDACPRQCRCDKLRKEVFCIGKELINLPLGIPTDTKKLMLQNNKLANSANLDYILSTLPLLKKLELSNNSLTAFPKNIPASVNTITMKDNTIRFIGRNSLANLKNLRELYLDNNQITNQGLSSSAFTGAENLVTLSLQGNSLSHFPRGLPSSVRNLHFKQNRISSIAAGTMDHLQKVISLDLSYNKLSSSSIESGAVKSMIGLKYLDMSYNLFTFIPPKLPGNMTDLILSHNNISAISMDAYSQQRVKSLEGLSRLKNLDLSFNNLKNIEPNSFDDLYSLKTIILHDNPWQCDCYLRYLMNWLVDTDVLVTMESNTFCFTPEVFYQVTLDSLDEESLDCSQIQAPKVNVSSTENTIAISWLINEGTNPSYEKYRVFCGELMCNNCSHEEIMTDINRGKISYVTSAVNSYDIFPLEYWHVREERANIEIVNLKSNTLFAICLMTSSDDVNSIELMSCELAKTKKSMSTVAPPKKETSNSPPLWLIITIAVVVLILVIGISVVLLCWRSISRKQEWKRRVRSETSALTYDPFKQIYTMPDSRREIVYGPSVVGGVNISNFREGNLSATKDAGNEFDVTLVVNSTSNPNLLALQSSPDTYGSYCSDSHDGSLSTSHTRTDGTTHSVHSHCDNNNVSYRESTTQLLQNFSDNRDCGVHV